jgi:hypothetical protein
MFSQFPGDELSALSLNAESSLSHQKMIIRDGIYTDRVAFGRDHLPQK